MTTHDQTMRIMNTETAQQRAKRLVDEFHHEIPMSIDQAGRFAGAIEHELERYRSAMLAKDRE